MKFVDMFCGMGTIRMGFEQAGHECVYSIEWDKHKRRIYEVIFGEKPDKKDIRAVRANDIPIADCWCFGAPCQDFSVAGTRAGLDGDRSSLVREVFRLLRDLPEKHRPEWLLYENVKGMLSSRKGLDYLEILCEMGELGYDCQWKLLNSKDFGVPQNRERVYTLGHLRARGRREIFPVGDGYGLLEACDDSNKTQPQANFCASTVKTRGCLKSDSTFVVISKTGKVKARNTEGRYASCLTGGAHSGGNHSDMDLIKQDTKIRRLTPRECMRLQGVPDSITDRLIAAGISDTQLYRAAGDACTVPVVRYIAERLT